MNQRQTKHVIDEFIRVGRFDVAHQQLHILGRPVEDDMGVLWFNEEHRQELSLILKTVWRERISKSKSFKRNKAKQPFSTPEVREGSRVKIAFSFKENCCHDGLLAESPMGEGRYRSCQIHHEKLVAYVYLLDYLEQGYALGSTCQQLDKGLHQSSSTSKYFDDKVSVKNELLKKSKRKRKLANQCDDSAPHENENLSSKSRLMCPVLNCDDDRLMEIKLTESHNNGPRSTGKKGIDDRIVVSDCLETEDENIMTGRQSAAYESLEMANLTEQSTVCARDETSRVWSSADERSDDSDFCSLKQDGTKRKIIQVVKKRTNLSKTLRKPLEYKRLDSCQPYQSDILPERKPPSPYVDSTPLSSVLNFKSYAMDSDIDSPRSPTPPPPELPSLSDDNLSDKLTSDAEHSSSGNATTGWLSKDTASTSSSKNKIKIYQRKTSRTSVKRHTAKFKKSEDKISNAAVSFDSKSQSPKKKIHFSKSNSVSSSHPKCSPIKEEVKARELKSEENNEESSDEIKERPRVLKFNKSLPVSDRRSSLDMETLMNKYKHWPDDRISPVKQPLNGERLRSSHHGCSAVVNTEDIEDVFEDCFIKEELCKPFEVDRKPNETNKMDDEIHILSEIQELQDKHLTYMVHKNEKYLREIFQGKRASRRHSDYKKGGVIRANLNWQIPLGMFEESQTDVIMDALRDLFCKRHNKYLDYLMRVMLPEILIKVFMDLKGTNYEETEELLDKY